MMGRLGLSLSRLILAWAVPAAGYLFVLARASRRFRLRTPTPADRPKVRVVIPAHDEARVIGACLDAVAGFAREGWAPDVVVIADNCRDATADIARDHGAIALERRDPEHPGKGHALQWAFQQTEILDGAEVVFLVDADTLPEPEALDAALARMDDGADVVQVALISRGSSRDDRSAMNWWTTTLMGRVRPRGLNHLGLPARLQGAGMAFRSEVLRSIGWPTVGISEDLFATEFFLDNGYRLLYTDRAVVWARSPETDAAARTQRLRWESGKLLALQRLPQLLASAVRRRSPQHAALAAHVAVPPTTVHAALLVAGVGLAALAGRPGRRDVAMGVIGTAALAVYLREGLRLMDDAEMARRALLAGPRFARWKLGLQIEAMRRFRNLGWERTPRDAMDTEAPR